MPVRLRGLAAELDDLGRGCERQLQGLPLGEAAHVRYPPLSDLGGEHRAKPKPVSGPRPKKFRTFENRDLRLRPELRAGEAEFGAVAVSRMRVRHLTPGTLGASCRDRSRSGFAGMPG
jgi:hypothetical protein